MAYASFGTTVPPVWSMGYGITDVAAMLTDSNTWENRIRHRITREQPFQGRAMVSTRAVPMLGATGGNAGLTEQVDTESNLRRPAEMRMNAGHLWEDLRNLEIPLSWSMTHLPNGGFQQPDDRSRWQTHTRIDQMNACQQNSIPTDTPNAYNIWANDATCLPRNSSTSFEQWKQYAV